MLWTPARLSRQFSLTLTQVWRYTLVPMNRSMSFRARVDTFFSMEPPLPMMMPLWLAFSQKMVASTSMISLSRSENRVISTAVPWGISLSRQ